MAFVREDAQLAQFVTDPATNLENIGRYLINANAEQVRRNGVDVEAAAREQAGQIGYQFVTDYLSAEALVNHIEQTDDRSPKAVGQIRMREIEKSVLLQTLDHLWREHLVTLEHLREVIGFRAFGQRDPLNEYKTEAFVLFEGMLEKLREAVTGQLMHLEPSSEEMYEEGEDGVPDNIVASHEIPESMHEELALVDAAIAGESRAYIEAEEAAQKTAPLRTRQSAEALDPANPATWGKVSRNAPCPCGSGKKYKHCHGRH